MKIKSVPFSRLSAGSKRVAIAKDAIKQLRAKKYQAQKMEYMSWRNFWPIKSFNQQNLTMKPRPVCCVCQLGAALCSAIRLFNQLDVGSNSGDSEKMQTNLKRWFSQSQMELMEAAYELLQRPPTCEDASTESERESAVEFGKKYRKIKDRQIAIFKNIIKNSGTFVP